MQEILACANRARLFDMLFDKINSLESKIEQSKTEYVSPWPIATLYTRAGMDDEALEWFEKALIAHDPNMPYLNIDPIFDHLRDNPRFQNLIKKIGL